MEFDAIVKILTDKFGAAVTGHVVHREQLTVEVDKGKILEICKFLLEEPALKFEFLTDLTAVDNMGSTPRFDVVYNVYSFLLNQRIRLRAKVDDGEKISTVESVWLAANWLEREIYDLFGIEFENHSNLVRILLWDGYEGHPLRKDFPLTGRPQKVLYK